mmetsp:Transcript_72612/g.200332  ORF Transcript_72612/g.200332 Transcript_72612/m.200332 type:complete len:473 (-) Transcript_72612:167-1585(-)
MPTEEDLERLLPWEVENKVMVLTSLFKVPLILFVGVFGAIAEAEVKSLTVARWSRDVLSAAGPSCYVHKLDLSKAPERSEYSLVRWMNNTFFGGTLGQPTKHKLVDMTLELAGRDLCGFNSHCRPDLQVMSKNTWSEGGIQHSGSFALMWMLYKLAFIGFHPVDRIVRKVADKAPYLKLLTEPYFQVCRTPMKMIVKALFYLRYKIMPNALLAALVTLEVHPACQHIVFYKMDWFWGTVTYYTICIDLSLTVLLYAIAFRAGTQLVGTWRYRVYKVCWFIACFFPSTFVFWDLMTTCQWNIFRLFRIVFRVIFTFDITFAIYIDFLQLFLAFLTLLEFVEFFLFIVQILYPQYLKRISFFNQLDFLDSWVGANSAVSEEMSAMTDDEQGSALLPHTGSAAGSSGGAASSGSKATAGSKKKSGTWATGFTFNTKAFKNPLGSKKGPGAGSAHGGRSTTPGSAPEAKGRHRERP